MKNAIKWLGIGLGLLGLIATTISDEIKLDDRIEKKFNERFSTTESEEAGV